MTIALEYAIAPSVVLLDKLSVEGLLSAENTGIELESYFQHLSSGEYLTTYKDSNVENPFSIESSDTTIFVNDTQTIPNMDTYVSATSLSSPTTPIVQLTRGTEANLAKEISAFNQQNKQIHVVFEFEKDSTANAKTMLSCIDGNALFPLNDLKDICIKSQFKKSLANRSIPGNLKDGSPNKNVDLYFDFNDYPINFCQCNNDAFMVTQPTTKQLYTLRGSMLSDLQNGIARPHTFYLEDKDIQTVLYKTPSQISVDAKTYKQALMNANVTDQLLCSLFDPQMKISGIDYSYVIGIDQNDDATRQQTNKTIYENGDVFGSFTMTKSMYNSLYSMEMSDQNHLDGCRKYCGIQNSQNKILLKFYDNTDYEFLKESNGVFPAEQNMCGKKYRHKQYPYQKVEYYFPTKTGIEAKHKSNLFSINISNSGLDDLSLYDGTEKSSDPQQASQKKMKQHIAEQVKRDIMNGVRALAESIAPANTQLFNIYYK